MSEGIATTNKRSSNSSDNRMSASKIATTVQSKKSDIFAIRHFCEIFAGCIIYRNFAEVIFANMGQNRKN